MSEEICEKLAVEATSIQHLVTINLDENCKLLKNSKKNLQDIFTSVQKNYQNQKQNFIKCKTKYDKLYS